VVQRLNHTYGPQPSDEDPGAFSFWMAMVLPIDEHEKAKLLPIKSARLRLRMIVGWIEQLNSNWWVLPILLPYLSLDSNSIDRQVVLEWLHHHITLFI
jgi:hypothetical protein